MRFTKLIPALLILGFFVITGCGPDPEPEPTEEELQLEKLVGTWKLGSGSVTLNGDDRATDWAGFEVIFTDSKGYSTNEFSFDENVWPSVGTWAFQDTTGSGLNVLERSDGIILNINSISATSLTLNFNYVISRIYKNGRVESIEGNWIFSLSK